MTNRTDILRDDASDPFAGERLKVSYFHDREKVLNLRDAWSSWNGFKFADYYYDVDYEYFCIRNTCGTYDICPMQKYLVEGEDALPMLNRMVTRDLNKLRDNRVTYVAWCTDLRQPLLGLASQRRLWICQRRGHRCDRRLRGAIATRPHQFRRAAADGPRWGCRSETFRHWSFPLYGTHAYGVSHGIYW